jgi:hypothetical protein
VEVRQQGGKVILKSILTGIAFVVVLVVIAYVRFVLAHPGAAFDTSVFAHYWGYALLVFVIGVGVGWKLFN